MTIGELAKLLNVSKYNLAPKIKEVSETLPSLAAKYCNGHIYQQAHFTREEIEAICDKLNLNSLQKIYILEHFKDMPSPDIYEVEGTHKFLDEYNADPDIKCCNTCKFLIGVVKNNKPQPYCKVYEMYLKTFNAKVYEDWCSSYLKVKLPKPRIWYKETAPSNLNMYGETDTVNGIKIDKLMNSERSVKGVVTRVNQVGFDV